MTAPISLPTQEDNDRLKKEVESLLRQQEALLHQAGRDIVATLVPHLDTLSADDLCEIANGCAMEVIRLCSEGGCTPERAEYFGETVFYAIGDAVFGGSA